MRNGTCPECGSDDIHSNAELKGATKRAHHIRIDVWRGPVPLNVYVCGNCGYVRTYIAKEQDLRILTEKWPRVMVSGEVR
jgi:uncharacterized Zn finger protein